VASQVPGAVEWVKPRIDDGAGVADVVQPGGGEQHVGIVVGFHHPGEVFGAACHRDGMAPALR
jgi:hypothetical protein